MAKFVIKSSGESEPFDIKKFKRSLKKSGAPDRIIHDIAQKVLEHEELKTTSQIYSFAKKELKKINRPLAARYTLKRALFAFGPSGYPFEHFVAQLLKALDYTVHLNQFVQGYCVMHEIDVLAQKEKACFLVECKFHNQPGIKADIKIPLYIQARFLDIKKQGNPCKNTKKIIPWLVTNTQITSDAMAYGHCVDMMLTSWLYPPNNSLEGMIDQTGLYPITCLTTISAKQKKSLLSEGIVLCKDVHTHKQKLKDLGLSSSRIQKIIDEAHGVCTLKRPKNR